MRGAWVAQSVKHPTWAQVVISQSVSSSPASGSVPTAQNLEPASDSVSPSRYAPPLLTLSLSKINIKKTKRRNLQKPILYCILTKMKKNLPQ